MITRKRKRKPNAADHLEAARDALPVPRPGTPAYELMCKIDERFPQCAARRIAQEEAERARQQSLAYEQALAEVKRHMDPHERLSKALKASLDGMQRGGGKKQPGTKTADKTERHQAIIDELKFRGVPLARPYTKDRRDAITAAMVETKAYLSLNAWRRPKPAAFIKHLQRHYKK